MIVNKRTVFVFGLLICIHMLTAEAVFYDIWYDCHGKYCIEGAPVDWYINITNNGRERLEITSLELVDIVDKDIIAYYEGLPTNVYLERDTSIEINPGRNHILKINGTVPKENAQFKNIFFTCVTLAVPIGDTVHKAVSNYELKKCYKRNWTIPVIECLSNNECQFDKRCAAKRCISFNCGSCQYIAKHTCNDYECCDNASCAFDEQCIDHTCTSLNCSKDQVIANNTCTDIVCNYNEHVVNHTCVRLDCSDDEYYFNNSCRQIVCRYDEYIENRACKKLECKKDEAYHNHTCIKLNCSNDEAFVDHECKKLKCPFWELPYQHACVKNEEVLNNMFKELSFIILICFLLYLDIKKYMRHHGHQ